jgi:hypothetical protein
MNEAREPRNGSSIKSRPYGPGEEIPDSEISRSGQENVRQRSARLKRQSLAWLEAQHIAKGNSCLAGDLHIRIRYNDKGLIESVDLNDHMTLT